MWLHICWHRVTELLGPNKSYNLLLKVQNWSKFEAVIARQKKVWHRKTSLRFILDEYDNYRKNSSNMKKFYTRHPIFWQAIASTNRSPHRSTECNQDKPGDVLLSMQHDLVSVTVTWWNWLVNIERTFSTINCVWLSCFYVIFFSFR